jgi:hypothetical protein
MCCLYKEHETLSGFGSVCIFFERATQVHRLLKFGRNFFFVVVNRSNKVSSLREANTEPKKGLMTMT